MRQRLAAIALAGALVPAGAPATGVPGSASYVVGVAPGVSVGVAEAAASAAGANVTGAVAALGLLQVEASPAVARSLRETGAVGWIHRERVLHPAGVRPNDPLFPLQWPLRKMGALQGWRVERGTGAGVVVAVVDTGVDYSHPDLRNRTVPGFDFVNMDDDPADDHGHGTHVAGIVAAEPDNRTGIAGVSWGASVMPLKVCPAEGGCGSFEVTAAIAYAVQGGAKVVNLSLAGAGDACPPEFELAAALAEERDVLLVAGAGNSAGDGNPVMYPAACEGFVGVGATAPNDDWAPFSEHGDFVDLAAPGVAVPSTIPPGLSGMTDGSTTPDYGPADGTSMAAPHVAGLAALLFAAHPEWTALEVEERMEETAVDLGKRGADEYFGAGRISIARALVGS